MAKKKIVFLLQNGIGFGHFKLALTISRYIDSSKYKVIFITQAKSTRIFEGYNYQVFNIPPTYSLNNNNEVLLVYSLVEALIRRIRPSLVIEDTYPDDFYLNIPSLLKVPKLLIVNRLLSTEFENYYYSGLLGQYDKLLILKNQKAFQNTFSSVEVKNYVSFSERLIYCDNVFNSPSSIICSKIREKYNMSGFEKTIVVNCGAGGWHIGENVCKTIFGEILKAANNIIDESHNYQFIFISGPYSSYLYELFKPAIIKSSNIRFIDFEDHADALFKEADLVILRPGYNSTMEALSGSARILLIPGISYMEDQIVWCEELRNKYGISYLAVDNICEIEAFIRNLTEIDNETQPRNISNNAELAALEIMKLANECEIIHPAKAVIACSIIDSLTGYTDLETNLLKNGFSIYCNGRFYDKTYSITAINTNDNACLNSEDVLALFIDEKRNNRDLSFYNKRYHFTECGKVVLEFIEVVFNGCYDFFWRNLVYVLKHDSLFPNCIVLSFNDVPYQEIKEILLHLEKDLQANCIELISIKKYLSNNVELKIGNYSYSHSLPEITKLQK